MERKDAIRDAYRLTGSSNFYDGMITCSTKQGKAVCRIVWGMDTARMRRVSGRGRCPAYRTAFPGGCWRCRWARAY